jgi:hypothetical protein
MADKFEEARVGFLSCVYWEDLESFAGRYGGMGEEEEDDDDEEVAGDACCVM